MEKGYKDRYPGIRAFEEGEQYLFFGRKQEVKKLYSMVKARPLVVLFAKSGIGKSSIINAGLVPILDPNLYLPIKVRLQDTSMNTVDLLKGELHGYLNEDQLNQHGKTGFKDARLWEFMRSCEFTKGDQEIVPIIIFDQFEEFFEHPLEGREALIDELSDLLSDRLPERIQEQLRAIPRRERTLEQRAWHSPLAVKVIFAIRSDKLSLMDELTGKIPTILHNRLHLKPLHKDQAKEAIIEPGLLQGPEFRTSPFDYPDDTLQLILNFLQGPNGEIESFQLQLLCRHIEEQVFSRYGKQN